MSNNTFYNHITEAIEINRERKPLYASKTSGKSKNLSNFMLSFQYCLLPIARYFDNKGLKYNLKNIPIIENDFIPETVDSWVDGDIKLGFNISRVFYF